MVARIRSNPDFIELERSRRNFGWLLTVLMLAIYYGFIMLVAFAPSVIGIPISGSITVGLALGIAVILSAVILTGIYVLRANNTYDRLAADIVASSGGFRL